MIKIKIIISFFISLIIIGVIAFNIGPTKELILSIDFNNRKLIILDGNQYEMKNDFIYFKNDDDFVPNNYEDLASIFYTVINKGWKEFTFYCGDEYINCLEDVADISYNKKILTEMNNYVHPYNSYSTIRTLYDDTGEITIKVERLYSDEEIAMIDKDINQLISDNTNDSMSLRQKIKTMHDVIINNTKYDKEKADYDKSKYDSARINGVLYDHYAICSGYTDIMAVILTKFGVNNFKIASDTHVWNALYINNGWYHLDLTWDDPLTVSGRDVLDHSFFIISDNELMVLDKQSKKREHIYDKEIYLEFN